MTDNPEAAAPAGVLTGSGETAHATHRSARLVAAGILLSRIAGFLRDKALAHYLGTSLHASAFRAALRLPNVIQNLLGEGTLSASFIPVYARLLQQGDERTAGRLAGTVFALVLIAAGGLAVIGVTLAPVLVRIALWGLEGDQFDVTVRAVRIIFPMTGVLVLSAWALGILNSHRRFLLSYAAPVAWNATIIATAVAFGGRLAGADLVVALSWGALIGGVLQFLVQLPGVLRHERSLVVRLDVKSPAAAQVLRNAGPAIMGRGVVQLSAWLDLLLASFLFEGAIAVLGYAQALYVLPIGLFGMSVAAAELPEMARQADRHADALSGRLNAGLRRIAFFVIPVAAAYIVMGDVVVGGLLQGGEFTRLDTLIVHFTLAGYAIGLVASTSARLYASTFYALNDTRTPARVAFVRVTLAAALGAGLMLLLERYALLAPFSIAADAGQAGARPLGVVGLALASGLAAWVEWILLRRGIRRRVGDTGLEPVLAARLAVAALVPALALRAGIAFLPHVHPILLAGVVLPLFGAAYLLFAAALGVPMAAAMLARLAGGRARNGGGYQ